MEKRNIRREHGQPMEQERGLLCTCDSSITTPVSLLANKFDVRSILHGQVTWQLSIKYTHLLFLFNS